MVRSELAACRGMLQLPLIMAVVAAAILVVVITAAAGLAGAPTSTPYPIAPACRAGSRPSECAIVPCSTRATIRVCTTSEMLHVLGSSYTTVSPYIKQLCVQQCPVSGRFSQVCPSLLEGSNAKAIWANAHPMDSENLITKQAEMVLADDPGIPGGPPRVWVYR